MITRKFLTITLSLTLIGLVIEWLFSGHFGVIGNIVDILVIAMIVSLIHRYLLRRYEVSFRRILERNLLFVGALLGGFGLFFFVSITLINHFPAALSAVSLKNGERDILFLQMSHIGTESYYKEVRDILSRASGSGYVLYLEGVQEGTDENRAKFDDMIGIKLQSGSYDRIAEFIGMQAQDDRILEGISTGSLKGVDLSIDDIVSLVESGATTASGTPPIDIAAELEALDRLPKGILFGDIFRAVLNMSLRYNLGEDALLSAFDPAVADVLLKKRDQHVIDTYLESEDQDIVIVYGALHFEGMYAHLKAREPGWQITDIHPLYPYRR